MDVGQPMVAAVVTEGELLVVEAEEVQDGRVEIVLGEDDWIAGQLLFGVNRCRRRSLNSIVVSVLRWMARMPDRGAAGCADGHCSSIGFLDKFSPTRGIRHVSE